MVSVIAPLIASPQVFVLGIILVEYAKAADTFSIGTFFVYARRYDASVAEGLKLYHIYLWSYIILLHFSLLLFGFYLIIIFFPFTTYIPFGNPSRLQLRRTICPFMLNTPSMPRL